MIRRPFGSMDLEVSALGLGTAQLAMPYGLGLPDPPSLKEACTLLRQTVDLGVNYIDTAAAYDSSEEIIGQAFAGIGKPMIATKLTVPEPHSLRVAGGDLHRSIEESVAGSLRRLGLDSLDLMQIHNAVPDLMNSDLAEVMDRLTERGMVRHWGGTTYGETDALGLLDFPGLLQAIQMTYSVLDRAAEKQFFPRCREQRVGLVLRSVFLKGILSHRVDNLPHELAALEPELRKAEKLARGAGITLAELAFRFAAFCPDAHVTLFGTTSFEETKANVLAFEKGPLPPDLLRALDDLRSSDEELLRPVFTTPGWKLPAERFQQSRQEIDAAVQGTK